MAKNIWLMKSEPEVYSIEDLQKDKKTLWTGVRNYQARNFMMQSMKPGDLVLFYHSNAEPPGIAGLGEVLKVNQVDPTQFDKKSEYFDSSSDPKNPRWHCAEVGFVKKFKNFISLENLRAHPDLKELLVLKKGQRLSIQPVATQDFKVIEKLAAQ
jgi:predicted RNA-binding protein with PUA-like domain